jgi:hypothetical protein
MAITWGLDWLWSLPLIVLTVLVHALGLGLIGKVITSILGNGRGFGQFSAVSVFAMGGAVLAIAILHGLEAFMWAETYRLLDALPSSKSAMLYSLNAMTSYGHENLHLDPRWEMMGALESLNGWILFGLTTAFLFTLMQKVWARN